MSSCLASSCCLALPFLQRSVGILRYFILIECLPVYSLSYNLECIVQRVCMAAMLDSMDNATPLLGN